MWPVGDPSGDVSRTRARSGVRLSGRNAAGRRPRVAHASTVPDGNQFRCLSNVPARTGDDVPQGILWRHSDRADRGMSVRYSEIWPRVGSSVFTA